MTSNSTLFWGVVWGGGYDKYGYSHVENQLMKKEPEAELFPKSLVPFVHLLNNWSSKFEDASR